VKKVKKKLVKQDREAIGGPKHPRVVAASRIHELTSQVYCAMNLYHPRGKQAHVAERKLETAIRAYLKLPKFDGTRYDAIVKAEKVAKDRLDRARTLAAEKAYRAKRDAEARAQEKAAVATLTT
jgi:hypothetical protein